MILSKVRQCPACKSQRVQRYGYRAGSVKEYYCTDCQSTFRGVNLFTIIRIAFAPQTKPIKVSGKRLQDLPLALENVLRQKG